VANTNQNEKALRDTQTLHAGCSKAEPKNFHPAADPLPGGTGWPRSNQLEIVTTMPTNLQTQFGEDQGMQFQVIVVTDPQTHPQTNRQDRLQYTVPLSLARSVLTPSVFQET